MDEGTVARCMALVKTTKQWLVATVVVALLSVLMLVWELDVIAKNTECRVCVLDGTSLLIMPAMLFGAVFGVIAASVGRREAKLLSGVLKVDDLKRVVGWNRARMFFGALSVVLLIVALVLLFVLV